MNNTNNNFTVGSIIAGANNKDRKSFKVKVSDINKFAKHVEGSNKLSGKIFNGYWVKVHINDTISGDIWFGKKLVWLNSDNKKNPSNDGGATIVLPEHFTYNVKTFDKSNGNISQVVFGANDVKTLLVQKEQFILNLK